MLKMEHQIENFLDRVKAQRYRNSSTYTLLSRWEKPGSVCPIQGNKAGPGAEQRPSLCLFVSLLFHVFSKEHQQPFMENM